MIINDLQKDVQKVGEFQTSTFRIAASAKAFQILSSNIYTHKVRAVIREISCNAYDAHVAAKNDEKFDVHLPTTIEPWFSVRDYGTGLSEDDVRHIYTTYFCSTKTDSNEFIGALGLGSKSPFCLVDSFTVTSWFNNEKKVYSCFKDASGEPQIALLTCQESFEPQGLEVLVPELSGRRYQFIEEATKVFAYFDKIPNINLPDVVREIENIRKSYVIKNANDEFAFSKDHGRPKAVMGNVAYDIPDECLDGLNIRGYIRFNIGDLSFDPGRENLSLDDRTTSILKKRIEKVGHELATEALVNIQKESTDFRRSIAVQKFRQGQLFRYLRENANDVIQEIMKHDLPKTTTPMRVFRLVRKHVETGLHHSLSVDEDDVFYCLEKPRMDRRIKHFVKDTNRVVVVLTEEQAAEIKIDSEFLSDAEDIPKIPYNSTRSSTGKRSIPVKIWHGSMNSMEEVTDLPAGEKIYVVTHYKKILCDHWQFSESELSRNVRNLNGIIPMGTIYAIRSDKLNSKTFQKEKSQGEWIPVKDYILRELAKVVGDGIVSTDGLSHEDIFRLVQSSGKEFYPSHPAFEPFESFLNRLDLHSKFNNISYLLNLLPNLKRDKSMIENEKELMSAYPILEFYSNHHWDVNCRKVLADYIVNAYRA